MITCGFTKGTTCSFIYLCVHKTTFNAHIYYKGIRCWGHTGNLLVMNNSIEIEMQKNKIVLLQSFEFCGLT